MKTHMVALVGLVLVLSTCHYRPPDDAYHVANAAILPDITRAVMIHSVMCAPYCGKVTLRMTKTETAIAVTKLEDVGESEILYNPVGLDALSRDYGHIVVTAIILHELGHHRDLIQHAVEGGDDEWYINSWVRELSADWWSGCALAKAGADLKQWTRAMAGLSPLSTPSHPSYVFRNQAILSGAKECESTPQQASAP